MSFHVRFRLFRMKPNDAAQQPNGSCVTNSSTFNLDVLDQLR